MSALSTRRCASCPGCSSVPNANAADPVNAERSTVNEFAAPVVFDVRISFCGVEDVPSLTNDGRPKRWVVVRPAGAATGILLARADGDHQAEIVGKQFAGRVGFFLRVDDFEAAYARMVASGVAFVSTPRVEPYGQVAVFLDLEGNRWDLLGPSDARRGQPG